jgi:hypothetical protein
MARSLFVMKPRTRAAKKPPPVPSAADQAMANTARLKAAFATLFMERSHALFLKTKNPIHAWRVYELARFGGVPIPTIVLEYFDRVAKVMTAESGPSSPRQIATAIEMGTRGGQSKARLARIDQRDLDIVGDVLFWFDRPADLNTDDDLKDLLGIMQRVADQRGLSLERVQAVCRKLLGRLPVPPA